MGQSVLLLFSCIVLLFSTAPGLPVYSQDSMRFPDRFSTRIQLYLVERKVLTELKLIYDKSLNSVRVEEPSATTVYNFDSGQLMTIQAGAQCTVSSIEDYQGDEELTIAGINIKADKVDGRFKIFGPEKVFSFDAADKAFSMNDTVDNVKVQKWSSTKLLQGDEYSMKCAMIHWIVSNETNCGDPDTVCPSFPIKMEMTCSQDQNGMTSVIRLYDFATKELPSEIFQQPLGVYCFGRKDDPLPMLATRFSYNVEQFIPEYIANDTNAKNMINRIQTHYWYDSEDAILMESTVSNGFELQTKTLYEYSSGVTYSVDLVLNRCLPKNDSLPSQVPDPNESVWTLDKKYKYQSIGERVINGISYVVFVATNQIEGENSFEVHTLHYIKNVEFEGSNLVRHGYVPAFQEIAEYTDLKVVRTLYEKISGFQFQREWYFNIDVISCFKPEHVIPFQLTIDLQKGEDYLMTPGFIELFQPKVFHQLVEIMGVPIPRVNQVQFYYNEVEKTATVLGVVTGNWVELGVI